MYERTGAFHLVLFGEAPIWRAISPTIKSGTSKTPRGAETDFFKYVGNSYVVWGAYFVLTISQNLWAPGGMRRKAEFSLPVGRRMAEEWPTNALRTECTVGNLHYTADRIFTRSPLATIWSALQFSVVQICSALTGTAKMFRSLLALSLSSRSPHGSRLGRGKYPVND